MLGCGRGVGPGGGVRASRRSGVASRRRDGSGTRPLGEYLRARNLQEAKKVAARHAEGQGWPAGGGRGEVLDHLGGILVSSEGIRTDVTI